MNVPERCKNCVHKVMGGMDGDVPYCDYTEYYGKCGEPVPYPYFFKEDYSCKGYEVKAGVENE